jgi:hypothetical protein
LYDAGVDALIVQDLGVMELDIPPIELHASTQTDIRTLERAKFLDQAGFSQLVLARELNLKKSAPSPMKPMLPSSSSSTAPCAWRSPGSATFPTRRPGAAPTVATAPRPAVCRTPSKTKRVA